MKHRAYLTAHSRWSMQSWIWQEDFSPDWRWDCCFVLKKEERNRGKWGLHCHLCCCNCTGGCSHRSAARSSECALGRQSF